MINVIIMLKGGTVDSSMNSRVFCLNYRLEMEYFHIYLSIFLSLLFLLSSKERWATGVENENHSEVCTGNMPSHGFWSCHSVMSTNELKLDFTSAKGKRGVSRLTSHKMFFLHTQIFSLEFLVLLRVSFFLAYIQRGDDTQTKQCCDYFSCSVTHWHWLCAWFRGVCFCNVNGSF